MSSRTRSAIAGSPEAGTAVDDVRPRLRFWHEVIYTGLFYGLYSLVRNLQGSAREAHVQALTNAERVIGAERLIGMWHEESIQEVFLHSRLFIQFLNTWYGVAHFVVTIWAMVWCFRVMPERYRAVRNGLALITGMALIGFAFFPLLPPRLLPTNYGFVDTLRVFGGPWSFDSGPMSKVSNQYAAMPSLHFAWASWSTATFWPWATTRWRKAVLILYPLLTLFAIVVTANHYSLDALGGFVTFLIGSWLGLVLVRVDVVGRARARKRMAAAQKIE